MYDWSLTRVLEISSKSKLKLNVLEVKSIPSYLHSCAPSITHGHLNCDSIYIHHDGIIKVGSVAPNIIKDFLSSLLEDKDFG